MAQDSIFDVVSKIKTTGCDSSDQPQTHRSSDATTVVIRKSKENIVKTATTMSAPDDNRVVWAKKFYSQKVSFAKLSKDFLAMKAPSNCSTTAMDKHYDKCRYSDIPCNDATRVILQNRSPENDFIHANWMTMPDGFKYISTQGPMDETIDDFWHMVVTENVSNILMVCDFSEGLLSKCAQYIPLEKNEKKKFGEYTVKRISKITNPMEDVKHQIFELFHKDSPDHKYTINHYQYMNWPDHTAPKTSTSVIKLYRIFRNPSTDVAASDQSKSRKRLQNSKPVIVHCSAGIGRTAVFIGVDYCCQRIIQNPDVAMFDLVREMRKMRDKAVQSHYQFNFLILCITELFLTEGVPRTENINAFCELYKAKIGKDRKKTKKKKGEK